MDVGSISMTKNVQALSCLAELVGLRRVCESAMFIAPYLSKVTLQHVGPILFTMSILVRIQINCHRPNYSAHISIQATTECQNYYNFHLFDKQSICALIFDNT